MTGQLQLGNVTDGPSQTDRPSWTQADSDPARMTAIVNDWRTDGDPLDYWTDPVDIDWCWRWPSWWLTDPIIERDPSWLWRPSIDPVDPLLVIDLLLLVSYYYCGHCWWTLLTDWTIVDWPRPLWTPVGQLLVLLFVIGYCCYCWYCYWLLVDCNLLCYCYCYYCGWLFIGPCYWPVIVIGPSYWGPDLTSSWLLIYC